MKKSFKLILAGVLMGAICTACDKPKQQQESEGTDVSFTRYAWSEDISFGWTNLDDVGWEETRIIVINSNEELSNYITGNYASVDFSKKTLVLAYGGNIGHIFYSDKQDFRQISEQNYVMTVNVPPSAIAVTGGWRVAVLIDKLPPESKIELIATALPIDR